MLNLTSFGIYIVRNTLATLQAKANIKKLLDYHPLPTLQNPADPENFIPSISLKIKPKDTALALTSDKRAISPLLVVLIVFLAGLVHKRAP